MNLREVVRTLRFERRRVLAMSRVCDPVLRKTMNAPPARSASRHRSSSSRVISTGERTAGMIKIEVIDNFAKSTMDGSGLEITAELIMGLTQVFMAFEADTPGSGHAMLKAVRLAIENNTIVDTAAELASETQYHRRKDNKNDQN